MRLSLIVGLAMLIVKTTVYFMTHSAAIFSDAAESGVHVIAVGFAAFSLRLSAKSASPQFLYGYERITFFSAGFEGAMIIVAAVAIFIEAIRKWVAGLQLEHLGTGVLLVLVAAGATVPPGMAVPDGALVAGVPARVVGELSPGAKQWVETNPEVYRELARRHAATVRPVLQTPPTA